MPCRAMPSDTQVQRSRHSFHKGSSVPSLRVPQGRPVGSADVPCWRLTRGAGRAGCEAWGVCIGAQARTK